MCGITYVTMTTPPAICEWPTTATAHSAPRSHVLRTLGLGLGALMVAVTLYRRGGAEPPWALLALLAVQGAVWPHVAWWLVRRAQAPLTLDRRLFMGDVALGGLWIAAMQFNLLPSIVLATMFALAAIAIDGTQLLLRVLALLAVVAAIAGALQGFAFAPATDTYELLATLPLLVAFPLTLGCITHRLARRVRIQNEQLLRMSSTDNLSGLMNRNHWEVAVRAAMARHCCERSVMLMMDIDRFKHVNDQFGHTAGDSVIQRVGEVIRSGLRDGDLAGRYGGDEFAVVLCAIDAGAAAAVAERIRSNVACSLFAHHPGLRCTLSIGLAPNPDSRDAADWVKLADDALYRAKLAGRNRLVSVP